MQCQLNIDKVPTHPKLMSILSPTSILIVINEWGSLSVRWHCWGIIVSWILSKDSCLFFPILMMGGHMQKEKHFSWSVWLLYCSIVISCFQLVQNGLCILSSPSQKDTWERKTSFPSLFIHKGSLSRVKWRSLWILFRTLFGKPDREKVGNSGIDQH